MALKIIESKKEHYAKEMLKDIKPDIDNHNLKQVTFRINAKVYDELCCMAKKMGLSKSSMVRIAVGKLVKEKSLSL